MAHNLCEELVVVDINPEAIECVKLTIKENNLEDKVRYYISDVLDNILENEKFDLVVGNPPHFNENTLKNFTKGKEVDKIELLKAYDEKWKLHEKFYLNIHKFLNKGANIILVENSEGSNPKDFIDMIKKGNLKYMNAIKPNLEDIREASYIIINSLDFNSIPTNIAKRLPYNLYKIAFTIGYKLNYKNIRDISKFYFIWSKYKQ